jgi:hypothetical protein
LVLIVDICGNGPAISSSALQDLIFKQANSFKEYIWEATFGRYAFTEDFSLVLDIALDCENFQATCNVDDLYPKVLRKADESLIQFGTSSANFAHRVSAIVLLGLAHIITIAGVTTCSNACQ